MSHNAIYVKPYLIAICFRDKSFEAI